MDDPFGPSIIIAIALALAAVVRMAEAAVPFLDEGELNRKAEDGDAKARRALRLVQRAEKPFGEFRMAWTCLLLIAASVSAVWAVNRFCRGEAPAPLAAVLACALLAFSLVALIFFGVMPGHIAAHWREKLFDHIAAACEWTLIALSPVTRLSMAVGALLSVTPTMSQALATASTSGLLSP